MFVHITVKQHSKWTFNLLFLEFLYPKAEYASIQWKDISCILRRNSCKIMQAQLIVAELRKLLFCQLLLLTFIKARNVE